MNRINLITLGVRDIGKSLKFYRNIGFETSVTGDEEKPVIVFFKNEGSKLELFPIEELAKDINEENPPELSKGGSLARGNFDNYSDIDLHIIVSHEKKADFIREKKDRAKNGEMFYITRTFILPRPL